MKHYIEEIRQDTAGLTQEARRHLRECAACSREYQIMRAVETGIESMTESSVPAELKIRIFARISSPVYRLWHLLAAALMLASSPVLLKYLLTKNPSLYLNEYTLISLFVYFGILIVLVLLPLTFQLFGQYETKIHEIEKAFDHYLEHPVRNLAKIWR